MTGLSFAKYVSKTKEQLFFLVYSFQSNKCIVICYENTYFSSSYCYCFHASSQ